MANITIAGASYSDVPAIECPTTGGGTTRFTDVSDTDAVASDVAAGKYFYNSSGIKTVGTGTGGGPDLSHDTVAADKLLYGYTAHNASGQAITGTFVPPGVTQDANGYIVVNSTGISIPSATGVSF